MRTAADGRSGAEAQAAGGEAAESGASAEAEGAKRQTAEEAEESEELLSLLGAQQASLRQQARCSACPRAAGHVCPSRDITWSSLVTRASNLSQALGIRAKLSKVLVDHGEELELGGEDLA